MAQQLSLLGWSATGFRCPDHKLSLERASSSPYPVALIQMPNGTGKTTTLKLLRAALSGSAKDWSADVVESFRKDSAETTHGEFLLDLAADGARITIELVLDYGTGTAAYRTTHGSSGIKEGFRPPPGLKGFLSPEFVDLFVFDGELAGRLLDSRHTRARDAIDALFQLSLLGHVGSMFEDNWEERANTVTGKGEKAKVRRKNRWEKLRKHLEALEAERSQLALELSLLKRERTRTELRLEELASQSDSDAEQIADAKELQARAITRVEQLSGQLVDKMREPEDLLASFRSELLQLKESLDTLKLPRTTSREFFIELCGAKACICGRSMTDSAREHIQRRAEEYLGEDAVGVLNSMKGDIATRCSKEAEVDAVALAQTLTDLKAAVADHMLAKNQLRAVQDRRIKAGDRELQKLRTEAEDIGGKIRTKESRLDELNAKSQGNERDDSRCIAAVKKLCKRARDDYAEITETLDLKGRTQVVLAILENSREKARLELGRMVIRKTNDLITQLLPLESVTVSSIDNSVRLEGQEGGSVGQTLAVGYAFLATLFSQGAYALPFVVDSPAGALDNDVRKEVAGVIPGLCHQFVAFTISSERPSFTEVLADTSSDDVYLATLFRRSPKTEALVPRAKDSGAHIVGDGVLVHGESYFGSFQLEEE